MSELLTLDDAAKYLKISKPTLKKYVRSGELETIKYGGKVVVDMTSIESFLNSHRRHGTSRTNDPKNPKSHNK